MKKIFKIGCLSFVVLAVIFYLIGNNSSDSSDYTSSDVLKYQNPELKSQLIKSENRENSEFEFMSSSIISTKISVSSDDKEEESRLARIIDNDLGIKGVYIVETIQTFDSDDNSKLLFISMTTKYKGFDYVLSSYNSQNENAYKINIESGQDFKVDLVQ